MVAKKLKVAIVIQRYGQEVAGGAEVHARWLGEHMVPYWDITVLTTKAKDYVTWKNEYEADEEELNGVKIRRFTVDRERNKEEFDKLSMKVFGREHTLKDELEWVESQGPKSTSLMDFLKNEANKQFDAFIFFQYLYYPTVFGMPILKHKSFLVPTAHDEPPIYLSVFKNLFNMPKGIIPSTVEEVELMRKISGGLKVPVKITGIGINVPDRALISKKSIERFGLKNPYMLYLGRIEPGKGSDELFYNFIKFKQNNPINLDLVLAGKAVVDIPKHKNIKHLGFVSEEEKFSLIDSCEFLINPSRFESLSMIIMEAWLLEKPVLVNGGCEVLIGQCRRSNGGLWFKNYEEFESQVLWLLEHKRECKYMGENGKKYVIANYSWDKIIKKFTEFVPSLLKK